MSILNTLYNLATNIDVPDFDDIDDILDDDDEVSGVSRVHSLNYDSIAKQAKSGVMQFPFIVSRSLSFDNVQMTAKAGERNFASFLQVVFTMNQITDSDQPIDFVKQFHQNMKTSVNGPSDAISFVFNSSIPKEVQSHIMQEVKEGNIVFGDMFDLTPLNEKYLPKDVKLYAALEVRGGHRSHGRSNHTYDTGATTSGKGYNPHQIVKQPLPEKLFVDSDVKKANEMVPTLLHVRMLREAGVNGENSRYIDFIVGVKATIHPIDSADMIDHLVSIFEDRGKLFDFIRWTTGEVSLLKDLILNIDNIKGEIKGTRTGKSSMWWTALKNAKAKRKMNKYTLRQPILPNASLVISMEEADYIKANYGFDIMEDASGKKILDSLNILSFYVVDAASEVVYTFIDGNDNYEVNTFKGLERDSGNSERQFKDILKAVNKLQ